MYIFKLSDGRTSYVKATNMTLLPYLSNKTDIQTTNTYCILTDFSCYTYIAECNYYNTCKDCNRKQLYNHPYIVLVGQLLTFETGKGYVNDDMSVM